MQKSESDVFDLFSEIYTNAAQEELSLQEYLLACREDKSMYASAAERMLDAIGAAKLFDTSQDERLGRIFANRTIKIYPSFADFFGMEDTIERIVGYFRYASQGLEERKQILYLLGPVGGGKSSLAERLKKLMEERPFYTLKVGGQISPSSNRRSACSGRIAWEICWKTSTGSPPAPDGLISPWAAKRLDELGGDISQVQRRQADALAAAPDRHRQDRAGRREQPGRLDARRQGRYPQLENFSQSDPDAYSYSGGLNRTTQGLLEFVEMFKAPIKVLHPLLTATQEGSYNGTENFGGLPLSGHRAGSFQRVGMAAVQEQQEQ
jgi:serine protein kinase